MAMSKHDYYQQGVSYARDEAKIASPAARQDNNSWQGRAFLEGYNDTKLLDAGIGSIKGPEALENLAEEAADRDEAIDDIFDRSEWAPFRIRTQVDQPTIQRLRASEDWSELRRICALSLEAGQAVAVRLYAPDKGDVTAFTAIDNNGMDVISNIHRKTHLRKLVALSGYSLVA